MREQWRMLGVDPDQVRQANGAGAPGEAPPQGDYELPPELWDAWQCFVGTWHQWHVVAGLGGAWYEGIDHQALHACMQMLGIKRKRWQRVFYQVQVLESEARMLRNQKTQEA